MAEKAKIKICGLRSEEDIKLVNEYKPEYCGFIFWEPSKRYIAPDTVRGLISLLDPDITPVGVFLDEDIARLTEVVKTSGVAIVQLHGKEDDGYIGKVKELTGKPVIKSFKPSTEEDVILAEKSVADMIMFDPGAGSGKTFNWDILTGCKRDFFLAGGLDPDNAVQAVKKLRPYALDVSSGVETDGIKDGKKIEEFIKNTRNA